MVIPGSPVMSSTTGRRGAGGGDGEASEIGAETAVLGVSLKTGTVASGVMIDTRNVGVDILLF
jgi:hypothetical protein